MASSNPQVNIITLSELAPQFRNQIEEIFFLTSERKTFASEDERRSFFHRWTDYYLQQEPENTFLAWDNDNQKIAAYLTGCLNSQKACTFMARELPSYLVFEDHFKDFNAHLHINCHPEYQNQGYGRKLLATFLEHCKSHNVSGIHIITTENSECIGFYQNHNFDYTELRKWKDWELLLMGCRL